MDIDDKPTTNKMKEEDGRSLLTDEILRDLQLDSNYSLERVYSMADWGLWKTEDYQQATTLFNPLFALEERYRTGTEKLSRKYYKYVYNRTYYKDFVEYIVQELTACDAGKRTRKTFQFHMTGTPAIGKSVLLYLLMELLPLLYPPVRKKGIYFVIWSRATPQKDPLTVLASFILYKPGTCDAKFIRVTDKSGKIGMPAPEYTCSDPKRTAIKGWVVLADGVHNMQTMKNDEVHQITCSSPKYTADAGANNFESLIMPFWEKTEMITALQALKAKGILTKITKATVDRMWPYFGGMVGCILTEDPKMNSIDGRNPSSMITKMWNAIKSYAFVDNSSAMMTSDDELHHTLYHFKVLYEKTVEDVKTKNGKKTGERKIGIETTYTKVTGSHAAGAMFYMSSQIHSARYKDVVLNWLNEHGKFSSTLGFIYEHYIAERVEADKGLELR